MTQDGAGEFGEEALGQIEPGAMLGREREVQAVGGGVASRSLVFLRCCGMILRVGLIAVLAG